MRDRDYPTLQHKQLHKKLQYACNLLARSDYKRAYQCFYTIIRQAPDWEAGRPGRARDVVHCPEKTGTHYARQIETACLHAFLCAERLQLTSSKMIALLELIHRKSPAAYEKLTQIP